MKSVKPLFTIALLLLLSSSCSKHDDLSLTGTIFIEDSYFPGFPFYSERGYNTFGAYVDRKPFISTTSDLPVKVIENGDTTHLIIRGRMSSANVDLIEGEQVIKRVQRLYVDEELSQTKMSGCFNLKTLLNGEPISVSQRKFKFGVGEEYFSNY